MRIFPLGLALGVNGVFALQVTHSPFQYDFKRILGRTILVSAAIAALPSPLLAQSLPGQQVPYYEDYQAVPTPTPLPATSAPALPPATPAPVLPDAMLPPAFPSVAPSSLPSSLNIPPLDSIPREIEFSAPLPILPDEPMLSQEPAPPTPTLLPGETAVTVQQVQVVGATPELEQVVRQIVQTQAGGITSEQQIQRDVEALRATGLFVTVTGERVSTAQGAIATYTVEPVVVRSLQVVGAEVLPLGLVQQAFQPQIGQVISPSALQAGAAQINQWYVENGYPLAQAIALLPNAEGVLTVQVVEVRVRQVNLQFVNEEGSPVNEAGEPVTGRTNEDFLRREIQLEPGQIYRESLVREDLQRLQALELFSNATVDAVVDGDQVDVTYVLTERLSRSFNLGGGINTDVGLFGSITYQDRNFGGMGERLRAGVQVSGAGLEFNARFTSLYRESNPDRLGYSIYGFRERNFPPAFTDEVDLPNGDRIREGRFGGGFSVMRPVGEWDGELGLNYSRISIRDSEGEIFAEDEFGNPLTISDTGIDDLLTVSLQLTRDERDNPTNPSDGSVLSLSSEQSIPIGNGSIFMNRLQASYAYYVPVDLLGGGNPQNPEVLAFNVQGGTILGDAPPYNAFDLGGGNSIRGYGTGRVGTGRSYALASVEYRFPLFSPVGGVLFADFGTDLGTADEVVGEPAVVRDKPGSGFGVGAGVRVQSPFGLIRLDFGLNDQGDTRIHFGFGQRF